MLTQVTFSLGQLATGNNINIWFAGAVGLGRIVWTPYWLSLLGTVWAVLFPTWLYHEGRRLSILKSYFTLMCIFLRSLIQLNFVYFVSTIMVCSFIGCFIGIWTVFAFPTWIAFQYLLCGQQMHMRTFYIYLELMHQQVPYESQHDLNSGSEPWSACFCKSADAIVKYAPCQDGLERTTWRK